MADDNLEDDPKVLWQLIASNIIDECNERIDDCREAIESYKEKQHMFDALMESGLGFDTLPVRHAAWFEDQIALSFKSCYVMIGEEVYTVTRREPKEYKEFSRFQVDELLAYLRTLEKT
jgi:hypothetical protein